MAAHVNRPALTLHEAAHAMGVCYATANRLAKAGRLRSFRVGVGPKAQFRVPAEAIDEFMTRQQVIPVVTDAALGHEPVEDDTFR